MKVWRMSFRCGNHGYEMWPACYKLGVAAITYLPLLRVNLSRYSLGEPEELWAKLEPTQKASIRRVAYEMRKGDLIYVKQGSQIVGKGVVEGSYQFDSKFRLIDPDGDPWAHQIPVKWESDFIPVTVFLGSEPLTVKELSADKVLMLKDAIRDTISRGKKEEAIEGEAYIAEVTFRKRNRTLIEAKKTNSDYRCEICDFSFQEKYGAIGQRYIVAHHVKPIAKRSQPSETKSDEIVLLCANCHAMIHTQDPPILPEKLRKSIMGR